MTKRKRCESTSRENAARNPKRRQTKVDITIPIELSDENSMDDLHAKIQYSSSTAIVSE
jgi:hypothetical protein